MRSKYATEKYSISIRDCHTCTCIHALPTVVQVYNTYQGHIFILYIHLYTCITYCSTGVQYIHVWQSRVEIEHYSVAHFNRDSVQNAVVQNFRQGWDSYVLHRLIRYSCIFTACMSPAFNRSFALQCFKYSNAVE